MVAIIIIIMMMVVVLLTMIMITPGKLPIMLMTDAVWSTGPRRTGDHGLNQSGVLLQQALVGVALHVGAHRHPGFLVDQVHDQSPQLGRVLELVL